ncbi:hypothetical protein [Burkholderia sp. PAMC 26561]|uniref:hypothetical protein n=1 Tax=Burkholderia sp. PAMC 26561 TaxID=1795043 RepID=UPI00076B86CD|nr:hypothetical protein [Burkholderia sp. PAMC 26561]AME28742.1 hypothetical protein AXG89_33655 [Burkholderia sp. PAMC 26561]
MEISKRDKKKVEILTFLNDTIFNPILDSDRASNKLKAGIRLTLNRMATRDAAGIVHFYWSAVVGTDRSVSFSRQMREEGFTRFEEILETFRTRFNDKWIRS